MTVEITNWMSRAYEIGKKLKEKYPNYDNLNTLDRYERPEELDNGWTNTEANFLSAGFLGKEKPYIVTGWRYGNIPQCGYSYNYSADRPENGISLMETDNGLKTDDLLSAEFISIGRKVVKVIGILNTFQTGSDGEPLVWDAEII